MKMSKSYKEWVEAKHVGRSISVQDKDEKQKEKKTRRRRNQRRKSFLQENERILME